MALIIIPLQIVLCTRQFLFMFEVIEYAIHSRSRGDFLPKKS